MVGDGRRVGVSVWVGVAVRVCSGVIVSAAAVVKGVSVMAGSIAGVCVFVGVRLEGDVELTPGSGVVCCG